MKMLMRKHEIGIRFVNEMVDYFVPVFFLLKLLCGFFYVGQYNSAVRQHDIINGVGL